MNSKGQKVIIRNWLEEDFAIYRKWNDGQYEWMKYNGPYYPLKTKEEIDKQICLIKAGQLDSRKVVVDINTNKLIGTVSWYWQSIETNWMSVGIAIYDESSWGRGIGFDALGMWSQYLFDTQKEIVRLDLRTWSGHTAMMKLAYKLGYKLEARFRMARIVKGQYYDSLAYGVLKKEWQERYPNGFDSNLNDN